MRPGDTGRSRRVLCWVMRGVVAAGTAVLLLSGLALGQTASARAQASQNVEPPAVHDGSSPAYHAQAPRGPLPKTLSPQDFTDPRVQAAYAMAAKIKAVLFQQPCYCYCDKGFGHKSLLDCYTGTHAAECEVCLMEGIYAYQQTKQGKTPGEIRAAIKRGDWKTVNLNDYLSSRSY